jgi:hypothetical protein
MFKSEVKEVFGKELTKKEKVMLKDLTDCTVLGTEVEASECDIIIHPAFYAILSVHNDALSEPDYEAYVIVDRDGTKYQTSSDSFITSFRDIISDMEDEDPETWAVKVTLIPSKNRTGKSFLKAVLI